MKTIGLSKAKHLLAFARFLQRNGTRVEPILDGLNLPRHCLENPELLVPTFRIREFREAAAYKTGLANIAVHAVSDLQFPQLGEFGRTILSQSTLYRAIAEFCTLVNTESSSVSVKLRRAKNQTWFTHHQLEKKPDQWNSDLYMLIWMLRTVRLAAPDWSPEHLCIGFIETPERRAAMESLGCERATFGAKHTCFAVPHSMFAAPMQNALPFPSQNDFVNRQKMLASAPATTFAQSLRQAIESYDQKPWADVKRAAETAGLSIRTLQRRLGEEGLTYSAFVEQARFEKAMSLLETSDTPVADIAMHLGYSTHPNFTRAFQRWAGVSPSEFRFQRNGQNGDAPDR